MSCRRAILFLLLVLASVACGKAEEQPSSTGSNELPSGPPSTTTISGTVTAPDGASTAGFVVLTPASQATVDNDGAFSVEAYGEVPNLVMALVPGKTFGLAAVWTGDGKADINLDSTIVGFVLTSPLLATFNQERMAELDAIVRADEHFAGLRTALSSAYGSQSPWDDPDVETAAHDLIGSVFGKAATDDSLAPKRLELRRQPLELEVVHVALNESQVHNIDREYVDVEVRNKGGKVEVSLSNEMSMGVGSAHSWIVEVASLKTDAYPFSNGPDAFLNLEHDQEFERDGVLLHRVALPQASLFRYFDLVSLVIDAVTGKLYQAVGLDSVVVLPGDAPGVYVVRAYSGALADDEELEAIPSFPGGTDLHEAAQAVNVALAIWDIVSVIVDTKGVMPVVDKFVVELSFRLSLVRAEYLPKARKPTMNELSVFLQETFKTTLEVLRDTGVDIAGTAAEKKLNVLIKQSTTVVSGAAGTLKSVLAGLDMAGKVGHVGDALLMFIEQLWWVSPVETSIVVVGNPWPREEDCGECPPHHECVSGACVAQGQPRFTLTWNGDDDIDLHVEDPCGNEIFYGNNTADCQGFQGMLDVDDGAGGPASGGPENIFWEEGSAPEGEYRVWVEYFNAHGSEDEVHWVMTIRIGTNQEERLGILHYSGDSSREVVCNFNGSEGTCSE